MIKLTLNWDKNLNEKYNIFVNNINYINILINWTLLEQKNKIKNIFLNKKNQNYYRKIHFGFCISHIIYKV